MRRTRGPRGPMTSMSPNVRPLEKITIKTMERATEDGPLSRVLGVGRDERQEQPVAATPLTWSRPHEAPWWCVNRRRWCVSRRSCVSSWWSVTMVLTSCESVVLRTCSGVFLHLLSSYPLFIKSCSPEQRFACTDHRSPAPSSPWSYRGAFIIASTPCFCVGIGDQQQHSGRVRLFEDEVV